MSTPLEAQLMFCENLLILTNANAAWLECAVWCHSRATIPPFLRVNTKTPAWEVSHVTFITLSFVSCAKTLPSRSLSRVQGGFPDRWWKSRLAARVTVLNTGAGRPGRTSCDAVGSGSKEVSWRPGTHVGSSSEETSCTTTRTRTRPRLWWENSFHVFTCKHTQMCTLHCLHSTHFSQFIHTQTSRQVQISCQGPNKRSEERVTCFLPLINLSWMITCHGSSSNNGDFYPRGHAAGLE